MSKDIKFTTDHPNLDKLIETLGSGDGAEALGLARNSLAPSGLARGVRPAYEMAAAYWLGTDKVKKTENVILIVKLPSDEKLETAETVLKAFGGRTYRFKP